MIPPHLGRFFTIFGRRMAHLGNYQIGDVGPNLSGSSSRHCACRCKASFYVLCAEWIIHMCSRTIACKRRTQRLSKEQIMTQLKSEFPGSSMLRIRESSDGQPRQYEETTYQKPRLFIIGTASHMMRNNSQGHLKDGTGGWWVWGS
jgi:hypothetical protein